jgi:hypothetical protein
VLVSMRGNGDSMEVNSGAMNVPEVQVAQRKFLVPL